MSSIFLTSKRIEIATKKVVVTFLLIVFCSFSLFAQQIKEGIIEHPQLGKVLLKKKYVKEVEANYLIGQGEYINEEFGKASYVLYYYEDGDFANLEEEYQHPKNGRITITHTKYNKTEKYTVEGKSVEKYTRYNLREKIPAEITTRIDGKLEGERRVYYNNGILYKIENYKAGKQQGVFEIYADNKNLLKRGSYNSDEELDGAIESYNKFGDLIEKGFYENGKKIGEWKENSWSNDRSFRFRARCSYNKDSAICEERKFYVKDKSEKLLKIVNYKKVNSNNERDYVKPDYSDDTFGDIKQGFYKEFNADFIIKEGNFSNGKKIGKWKTYHENGNLNIEGSYLLVANDSSSGLKSVRHGVWEFFEENGNFSSGIRYYKGDEIIYKKPSFLTLIGGVLFLLGIVVLVTKEKMIRGATAQYTGQLKISRIILSACLVLIYAFSIHFLKETLYPLLSVSSDWLQIISIFGLSILVSFTVLFSIRNKPSIKSTTIGVLGYFIVWFLTLLISVFTISDFLVYLISFIPYVHDDEIVTSAVSICIACFVGMFFIYGYWKLNNHIRPLNFFVGSLVINLIVSAITTNHTVNEMLSFNQDYTIIFLLNYLICMVVLIVNSLKSTQRTTFLVEQ